MMILVNRKKTKPTWLKVGGIFIDILSFVNESIFQVYILLIILLEIIILWDCLNKKKRRNRNNKNCDQIQLTRLKYSQPRFF